jgi:hypothetical protein
MDNLTFKKLIKKAHENAVKHGFYDGVTQSVEAVQERLMLVISEIAELMEADRKARWFTRGMLFSTDELNHMTNGAVPMADFVEYYKNSVKGSAEEELADICIRCFDLLGFVGADEVSINHPYIVADQCRHLTVPILCYTLCHELTHEYINDALTCVVQAVVQWCEENDIDLMLHIKAKMFFNQSRPRKHGKAY